MARIDTLLTAAFTSLRPKPPPTCHQSDKKRYSEEVSNVVAPAFAEELRARGLGDARPAPPGGVGLSGAERRMSGGIGAKKVDVTWATPESGLLLGISIKTTNWRDGTTKNFQKNLINRRGDMLIEGVTLHRRFPYSVLAGFFFLDMDAFQDGTRKRKSTYFNAHQRLRIFTGREDPTGRDEQFERLYLVMMDANPFTPRYYAFQVGEMYNAVPFEQIFDDLIELLAQRNSDFYETLGGKLIKIPGTS